MAEENPESILDAWPRRQFETEKATGWSRLWARSVDIQIYGTGILIIAIVAFPTTMATMASINEYLTGLASLPAALLIEAISFRVLGDSLGKLIAGIKLQRNDGQKLTLKDLIWRNFHIWTRGYALGIPFVALFTLASSRSELQDLGRTPWDRDCDTTVVKSGASSARTVAAFVVMLVLVMLSRAPGFADAFNPKYGLILGAMETNKTLPKQLDDITRLDQFLVSPDMLEQHMTIVKRDGSSFPFDRVVAVLNTDKTRQDLRNQYCSSASMAPYREAGFDVRFLYSDSAKRVAADFRFGPRDCQTAAR